MRTMGMPGLGGARRDLRLRGRHGQPVRPQARHLSLGEHAVARIEPRLRSLARPTSCPPLVHRRHGGLRGDRGVARLGRPPGSARASTPSRRRSCCRSPSSIAGFIRPSYPTQVIVSYFQAGRSATSSPKNGATTKLLDMMHAFADRKTTPRSSSSNLGMKPEEFDKKFLAWLDAQVGKTVGELPGMEEAACASLTELPAQAELRRGDQGWARGPRPVSRLCRSRERLRADRRCVPRARRQAAGDGRTGAILDRGRTQSRDA